MAKNRNTDEEGRRRRKPAAKQKLEESDGEHALLRKASKRKKKEYFEALEESELGITSGRVRKKQKKKKKNKESSSETRSNNWDSHSDRSSLGHDPNPPSVSQRLGGQEPYDDALDSNEHAELLYDISQQLVDSTKKVTTMGKSKKKRAHNDIVHDNQEVSVKSKSNNTNRKKVKKKRDKWGQLLSNVDDAHQDASTEVDMLVNADTIANGHVDGTPDISCDTSGQYDKRAVCVGGMPYDTTEAEIQEMFGKCGVIANMYCTKFADTQRFKGFAFVTFETDTAATNALSLDGVNMGGRLIKVERARAGGKVLQAPPKRNPSSLSVYIGNLDWDVKKPDIKRFFKGCAIDNVRLAFDRQTGNFRGYGHVDFSDEESLERAINMDQKQLFGRPMKVSYSVPKGIK